MTERTGYPLTNRVIAKMLLDVERFNREVTALPIPDKPTMLAGDRLDWAITALNEESAELASAPDVAEQADALLDMTYFALGRLTEMGVPARAVWDSIQQANMAKERGSMAKRPGSLGHDAVKPEGWKAPDHSWLHNVSHHEMSRDNLLASLFRAYTRKLFQDLESRPRMVIVGHARHGKDTVAELLRDRYGFRFKSSSMWAAEHIMMDAFKRKSLEYPSVEACFNDRGNHRAFWFRMIADYCKDDKGRLGRELFAEHDIYVGIRNADELAAVKEMAALTVWVDASERVGPEHVSSCTVQPDMADVVLHNNLGEHELAHELDNMMACLLPRFAPNLFCPMREYPFGA